MISTLRNRYVRLHLLYSALAGAYARHDNALERWYRPDEMEACLRLAKEGGIPDNSDAWHALLDVRLSQGHILQIQRAANYVVQALRTLAHEMVEAEPTSAHGRIASLHDLNTRPEVEQRILACSPPPLLQRKYL